MFFRPNQFNVSSRRSSPRSLNFFTSGRFSSSARNSSSIQFPSRFGPISTKPEPASSRPCYHRHRDGATRPASPSRAQCQKTFYICNLQMFLISCSFATDFSLSMRSLNFSLTIFSSLNKSSNLASLSLISLSSEFSSFSIFTISSSSFIYFVCICVYYSVYVIYFYCFIFVLRCTVCLLSFF